MWRICLNHLDHPPDPGMLSDCSWKTSTEARSERRPQLHSPVGNYPSKNHFCLLRWQGSRGLKSPMLTLTLKQNVHSYPFTIRAKDVSCPSQSTFQRRISYCSELNPATEMHMGTDLKCGSFHETKSLTATPGCKFVLESFICYHWVNRMKCTKILVNHYTESGNLRMNSTQDSYPNKNFFHCQTLKLDRFPWQISIFILKQIYSRW